MHFADSVIFQGRANPHRPAIIWEDRVATYGMLADATLWVATRLHQAGIHPGETVAIVFGNPIREVIATLALMRLGAVSASIRGDQLAHLERLGATTILTETSGAAPAAARRLLVGDDWFTPVAVQLPVADPAFNDAGRVCRIAMTSGTTGLPKLAAATLGETQARIVTNIACHWCDGAARSLLLVGLSVLWGFNEVLRGLTSASTLCFAASAEEALRVVDLYKVDSIFGAPQQIRALLDALDDLPGTCASVRFIGLAGALVTPAFADDVHRRICRTIAVSYGSTEAGKTAAAPFERLRDVPGAVGYVLPDRVVEIVDAADRPLPAGTSGRVRIMAVAGGRPYAPGDLYPDRTKSWFYPGDVGRLLPDGMLVITGRSDELLNAGGNKIAPDRIDQLVAGRRDIADAAAFGRVGASGLQEVWLAIVPKGPVVDRELIDWCEARLPEIPISRIVRMMAIPRNAMGKVERYKLGVAV